MKKARGSRNKPTHTWCFLGWATSGIRASPAGTFWLLLYLVIARTGRKEEYFPGTYICRARSSPTAGNAGFTWYRLRDFCLIWGRTEPTWAAFCCQVRKCWAWVTGWERNPCHHAVPPVLGCQASSSSYYSPSEFSFVCLLWYFQGLSLYLVGSNREEWIYTILSEPGVWLVILFLIVVITPPHRT